jgi:hypothetical protein
MNCKFHPDNSDCLMPYFINPVKVLPAFPEVAYTGENGRDFICVIHEADLHIKSESDSLLPDIMTYLVFDESPVFKPYLDRIFLYMDPVRAIEKAIELGYGKPISKEDLKPFFVNEYRRTDTLHIRLVAIPLLRGIVNEHYVEMYKDRLRHGIQNGQL